MSRFLDFVDTLSMWTGKAFAWCILVLTFAVSYEVFVRYVLRDPTAWAFDISYIMYGALFMMGGAYTLSREGHVRADFLYRLWPPRVQATVTFILYFLFFFPGVIALVVGGYAYADHAWGYKEVSINSPIRVPIYPLKMLIPVAASILLLQGIAETIRCVICMRDGAWPRRIHDVEELQEILIHQHEAELAAENAAPSKEPAR